MKRLLPIVAALLAGTASVASAGGVNLAWNDCYGAGGVVNRPFACNTNAGSNDLFVSFDPPQEIPDLNGSNPIIDLVSSNNYPPAPLLPQWWQFKNIGTCRQNSLKAIAATTGTCPDAWGGVGVAGIAAYLTTNVLPQMPQNRARILGSISVPGASAQSVHPGTEYICLQIRFDNAKTVGTACTGCADPVCLVLMEVLLTTNASGDFRLTNQLESGYCVWQGGAIGGAGCPASTPTINRTWGQLKASYR